MTEPTKLQYMVARLVADAVIAERIRPSFAGVDADGRRAARLLLIVLLALALIAAVGPIVASTQMPPVELGTPAPLVETEAGHNDAPIPVELPRDDAPHDVDIEWWYYTGHLFTDSDERYGFEFVTFKGHRGGLIGYAAHFAITDNPRGRFAYDQRLEIAPETPVATSMFDLQVGDWQMRGGNGADHLSADTADYAIDLSLRSEKWAVLHDGDGYFDYGGGGASYYYSRTRLAVEGTLVVENGSLAVTGDAWFDHQWGNFSTYESGWDWYAIQLDNGSELMFYVIRAPDGGPLIVDGSFVAADGSLTVLDRSDFTVTPVGSWTSPHSGAIYPSGWRVEFPAEQLALDLAPSLLDQELDTATSTNVVYWEGEVTVVGTHTGQPVAGLGYVELTGYAKPDQPEGRAGPSSGTHDTTGGPGQRFIPATNEGKPDGGGERSGQSPGVDFWFWAYGSWDDMG